MMEDISWMACGALMAQMGPRIWGKRKQHPDLTLALLLALAGLPVLWGFAASVVCTWWCGLFG